MPENTDIEKYIKSLSEKERMAYEIAKSHLGSTFSLEKSNGYLRREPTVPFPTLPNESREPTVPLRPLPHESKGGNLLRHKTLPHESRGVAGGAAAPLH
jgi:hypothetical protein